MIKRKPSQHTQPTEGQLDTVEKLVIVFVTLFLIGLGIAIGFVIAG